jgi:hypothetical protein
MIGKPRSRSFAVTVGTIASLICGLAAAQEDVPLSEPVNQNIIDPVALPDDDPYAEPDAEPVGAPDAPPVFEAVAFQENTPAMCRDGLDNDADTHVDCDDQDCEVFVVCADRERHEPSAPPGSVAEPAPEGPPRPELQGYPRHTRVSRKPKMLFIVANATFWPGLLIAGISAGVMIHNGGDSCTSSDIMGFCTSWFLVLGSALTIAGIVTGTIYFTKHGRKKPRSPGLTLAPLLDRRTAGVGGGLSF